jgi:ribosome modulation factor
MRKLPVQYQTKEMRSFLLGGWNTHTWLIP